MSKEKPILFNTEMVQAILEGRKTQTRRIVKPHRKALIENMWLDKEDGDAVIVYNDNYHIGEKGYIKQPYSVGDILWVRETWQKIDKEYFYKANNDPEDWGVSWKPSIHMPREAARIFLRVTNVRVERLQDITDKDVLKEGTNVIVSGYDRNDYEFCFMNLWDSTCTKEEYRWSYNPWVWVIEFERIEDYERD